MSQQSDQFEQVAIVGCGYTGTRLAEHFLSRGVTVRTFSRRFENLPKRLLLATNWSRLDLDANIESINLDRHVIYYLVPPPHQPGDSRLERFLEAGLRGTPRRLVYMSTTGVYGDQRGATVTEDTLPNPMTERASRRLAAETRLREWAQAHDVSWCILRVPGIYGPGRLPLERLRQRSPVIFTSEATPGNRIHICDLVTACVSAGLAMRAHRQIYNISDGSKDSHTEFMQKVARIAGLPLPPLISRTEAEKTFTAVAWSFLAESRRVDNRRMLAELRVSLKYSDLDAGIRDSLSEEQSNQDDQSHK